LNGRISAAVCAAVIEFLWEDSMVRLKSALLLVAALVAADTGSANAQAIPKSVDLTSFQTPLRDQGRRTTCITFAALAALEAAYSRAGYGQLDLSEQFLNHVGKMTWLHTPWSAIVDRGEDGAEGQVGAFAGGGGAGYIRLLATGYRVSQEAVMPYRGEDFTATDHPHLANLWSAPFWNKQRRMSDFNLDRRFFPLRAQMQGAYYSVARYETVTANDVDALEEVLAANYEIVWDFQVTNAAVRNPRAAAVWQPCSATGCLAGGHAMLLVGYDRSDPDEKNHYFIAKNSWGATGYPGGFTRISYDYVRRHGIAAAYVTEVAAPTPWPELAYLGRWSLNFDGHVGTLDIYHLPGIAQSSLGDRGVTTADRRIGSFYDASGAAYKVNGQINANGIEFYIDGANPMARWDQLGGRRFVYSRPVGVLMAGHHIDPDGGTYGGFAMREPTIADGAMTPRPYAVSSYLGSWQASFLSGVQPGIAPGVAPTSGVLRLDRMVDLPPGLRERFHGLSGQLTGPGSTGTFSVGALVHKTQPNRIIFRLQRTTPIANPFIFEVEGYHLNHTNGIVAGQGTTARYPAGFILVRQ
jgi:hypothetical protein